MVYQLCTRCIMDTSAVDISFSEDGTCNYCQSFLARLKTFQPAISSEREKIAGEFIARVKRDGIGKEYDCVIGVSGGADSAYALYLAKKNGLRPLAVHMDNGWDSELAANNIANLVRRLDVDLYTHVIDWEEYRLLMDAFFKADVIDVELLYDNAMFDVNYKLAAKYGIKWILAGINTTTEGMRMPANWNWFKFDKKNIEIIGRKCSNVRLNTFPAIGTLDFIGYTFLRKIHWVPFLDYFDYHKPKCMQLLVDELGFKPYPYKHYESVFTRFYQGYILPKKFNVDKRRLHLSTLICSGQMSRDEAISLMQSSPYPSQTELASDIEYFLKKMRWQKRDLSDYLSRPEIPHAVYGSERKLWDSALTIYRRLRRFSSFSAAS